MPEIIEIIVFALLGTLTGIASGLIPGMHINTIAVLLLGVFYKYGLPAEELSYFIAAMAVSHAISEFVPSTFLGAPNEATALSIAPAHRYLKKGRGYEAVALCAIGGVFSVIILAFALPGLLWLIPAIYALIRPHIAYVLIAAMAAIIMREKKAKWAMFVFALSGIFGIASLNSKVNSTFVLLPVLSGLFGLSGLALSWFSEPEIPSQRKKARLNLKRCATSSFFGLLGGIIAGILPGLGASQSTIIVQQIFRIKGSRRFLVSLGAIAVSDVILSILAIYLIGNPRSGGAVAIAGILGGNALALKDVLVFAGIGMFSAGVSAHVVLKIARMFGKMIANVNYRAVVALSASFLALLIVYFTGINGLLIALTGTAIGVIPSCMGVKKSLLLGCLIVPTVLYFLGIGIYFT